MTVSLPRNETDPSDKSKSKKNWLFTKKKTTICTSHNNIKSPEAPFLTQEVIKQLKVLMKFLDKDESEFNDQKPLFPHLLFTSIDLSQEGIFRKTGSVGRQQALKYLFNQLKPLNLDEYTCHDVASVMKSVLADMPEPLLTEV